MADTKKHSTTKQDPVNETSTAKAGAASVHEAKADVKESAQQLKEKAADTASSAAEKAKETAAELAETAKEKARAAAEEVRTRASERVETTAEAVEAARDKMPEGSPEERALDTVASAIREASHAISDTRLEGVVSDLETFARRNPLLFAAGAAALGFAIARVAKASQRRRMPARGYRYERSWEDA